MRSPTSCDSGWPDSRQDLRDQQPGNHAAVAIGEAAKIMVRAHLAAVHAVDLAHALLDEGMAGLRQHRVAAAGLDHLDRVPGQARIVHHPAARLAAQQHRGQQADDVVTLDEPAVLVEEKAAVEVAVPGDAEIRAVRADGLDGRRAILLEHGIRNAVRKMAVRLVVHLDELERQVRLQLHR